MPKIFGEQPREDENNTAGHEDLQIPDYLQKQINDLERMRGTHVPDWLKKDHQARIEKLQEEVDAELNLLRDRELINKDIKQSVAEKFGSETLKNAEHIAKSIGLHIEEHLSNAENAEDAQRIIDAWGDFSNAVSVWLKKNPERIEEGLEEARAHITSHPRRKK